MARSTWFPAFLGVCAAAASIAGAVVAQTQDTPRNDLPQPYRTTRDWGQLPPGVKWAAVTAVEAAPDGSIYVVHRCFANSCAGRSEAPILKYDASGRLLRSWGEGMFVFPHGGTVDRDGNLWVTDAGGANGIGHQVFKFSPEGKVLMTLGQKGTSGSTTALFDQPTDVVIAPNGDIFVTDSHRNGKNNRVMRFTREGTFVKQWGKKGTGRGEISEPHTIAMDSRGRLFVGDRENNRIQIFDQDGKYLDEWRQFGRPSGIFIAKDDTIYVADSESGPDTGARELPGIKKGIRIGSARDGRVTAFIEDMESTTPDHSGAEGLGVDAQGNVYGAVVRRQMLERHVRNASTQASRSVTPAEYERWKKELSNWGRWGKDDQRGALNLITPAKRRQAAALVKEGVSVSLAHDVDTEKAIDNPEPYSHQMVAIGADKFAVQFHGVAHTHLDSLAHINEDGVFYNGYKPDPDVVMKSGHARNSIHNVKTGIFTRGILIDIARLKGVPYLEPGTAIYPEDIEAWEKMAGVKVGPGDAVFIRTGRWAQRAKTGPFDVSRTGRRAGPSASVIPWLKQRDVALLGSDVPPSLAPTDVPGTTGTVHDFALVYLGVHLFDNCDLESLAEAAAARKRWEFLLTVAPLPIRVGTGSPVNPIATF